jgi:hypothetical protein
MIDGLNALIGVVHDAIFGITVRKTLVVSVKCSIFVALF